MSTPSRDWDAATYDRVSDIQFTWALEQLERLELNGDEVLVDAGCGSGRVTSLLADRLPRGRVYGVDVAPSMAAHAAEALGDRATILCQDLVALDLPEPVDVAFSNATFHWIKDHDALFAALHRSIKPGGRLLAQCGGKGNINRFRTLADSVAAEEPFDHYFTDWHGPWNYAGDGETAERLLGAGFTEAECWLEPRPVTPAEPRAFVQTVCLVRHLDLLPDELRGPFIDRVLARAGEPLVLDYVRLNLSARRGG
ncbi:MAG TPA: methyltransferase domain-containing protein [Solirubrobacteraceae bacterium]|nr:methyltransferase domain-containing protein [Solirubrobacteraceae bacterium]